MLSTLEELRAIPCGTQLASFCGQIVSIMPSEKKMTALLTCSSGENVAVTEFKNVSLNFSRICSLGIVVKMSLLRAQRFVVERFDGCSVYHTPLPYEFVVTNFTKIEVVQFAPKLVESFEKLIPGCLYRALITNMTFIWTKIEFRARIRTKSRNLYVSGEKLVEHLGSFSKNMQINLANFFVKVEDECLQIHCEVASIKIGVGRVNFEEILTTPVKRRSSETFDQIKKSQKNG